MRSKLTSTRDFVVLFALASAKKSQEMGAASIASYSDYTTVRSPLLLTSPSGWFEGFAAVSAGKVQT